MNVLLLLLLAQAPEAHFDERAERAKIKRVYVDKLTTGDGSEQIRNLLLAALHRSQLFIVTENPDKADAYLRGGGEDSVIEDKFNYRDSVDGVISLGSLRSSTRGRSAGVSIGEDDSATQSERRHEAIAALRLVNRDGDVVWATTKESRGSKVKSAAADLVERIIAQLVEDFRPRRAPPK